MGILRPKVYVLMRLDASVFLLTWGVDLNERVCATTELVLIRLSLGATKTAEDEEMAKSIMEGEVGQTSSRDVRNGREETRDVFI